MGSHQLITVRSYNWITIILLQTTSRGLFEVVTVCDLTKWWTCGGLRKPNF